MRLTTFLLFATTSTLWGCGSEDPGGPRSNEGAGGAAAGTGGMGGGTGGGRGESGGTIGELATQDDVTFLGAIATLESALGRHPEIWPSYVAADRTLLAVDAGERALIVNHPNPPPSLPSLEGLPPSISGALGVVKLGAGLQDALPEGSPFSFPVDAMGAKAFALAYPVDESLLGQTLPDSALRFLTVSIAAHEMFHVHQATWTAASPAVCGFPFEDVDTAALAWLEHHALANALLGDPQALAHFVVARHVRNAAQPSIVEVENFQEQTEGTARYVEAAAVERVYGTIAVEEIASLLVDDGFDASALGKWRHYETGAALVLLLDPIVDDLRERVAQGEALADLAAEVTAIDASSAQSQLPSVKLAYGFDTELVPEVAPSVEAFQTHVADVIQGFESAPGRLIRLRVPNSVPISTSSVAFFQLEDCTTYFEDLGIYLNGTMTSGVAHAPFGRSIGSWFEFHSTSQGDFEIDGRPIGFENGTHAFGSLAISFPDWSLHTTEPGTLTISNEGVSIELGAP